jgi:hypothetical protein
MVLSIQSFRLLGRPIWSFWLLRRPVLSFWLFGRPCSSSRLLSAGRSGTSCAFCPVPALGWSFLRFASPATGDLTAVSFLVVRPVFSPRRRLVVVTEGCRPLLDGLPQLLVLTGCFSSKVLNAGCNNLHLSLDRGHGRISTGPVIGSSFHN